MSCLFPMHVCCARLMSTMLFVELLRAICPFEVMPLTRDRKHREGHKQEREKFHRAA